MRKCIGGVALSAERFPVLSPLSESGAEGIASLGEQLFNNEVELFGPGLSKSMPCLQLVQFIFSNFFSSRIFLFF